ncbi:hypothetical protein SS50377_26295 [Spironucleus salmonicida]|uniref:Uncharacterized protein n=1 Tax=Spironucleus salmonicida TaxID=348837 RepID=V6M072_9EUKA|nr:hypothetical protein SS50377_26277 [Spironucleus salmonicida]KAH0572079.1 hypothetical protein SS50377_26286 [Spironucleus salmonicida]KAH0572088.1 hypothetical protein SS50377_26295 [Spironucleus salmonicida]|eukprot:EST49431.1 Hypothetical protein SS50377_10261 [Spironucleus salmonicida]
MRTVIKPVNKPHIQKYSEQYSHKSTLLPCMKNKSFQMPSLHASSFSVPQAYLTKPVRSLILRNVYPEQTDQIPVLKRQISQISFRDFTQDIIPHIRLQQRLADIDKVREAAESEWRVVNKVRKGSFVEQEDGLQEPSHIKLIRRQSFMRSCSNLFDIEK